jgi:GNAT superfamily N-acetyltransferase
VFDPDEFARHVFGDGAVARALIAEDDGNVAGFAVFFRTFSTWLGTDGIWLEDLFVRPAHRRGGHGRALLDAIRARTKGRVEWAVLDWNTSAHDFYRELGAAPLDEWTVWRWEPVK